MVATNSQTWGFARCLWMSSGIWNPGEGSWGRAHLLHLSISSLLQNAAEGTLHPRPHSDASHGAISQNVQLGESCRFLQRRSDFLVICREECLPFRGQFRPSY